ncbi:MAG TPA: DNA mismatch repair endonuclease MutL [Rectinemataceae bacterium]|nr:DNA mismatch repair endonuclease MutL [Rectinemataceae bacterium]
MARIHILPPETSRLIAAGEVIDRPASALRELIDNAIDSGASEIRAEIEKGGIDLIRVSDDGSGMSREDIELSILEHATSKIENADDLLLARTLGFRGEALASIAAVARLEMTSREKGADLSWRLQKEPGRESAIEPVAARQGTTVSVRGIFERFPARRQFLKRPSSEALLCRQVFVERALAHPSIAFVWRSGTESEHFPPSSQEERIALLYGEIPGSILSRFEAVAGGATLTLIYADPSFHRKDRKYLQVFVNRRKVPEWGFIGLLEYAFSEYLPGGMKPCAFLFAEIDPSQADFNIHPAKREVRIKNPEPIKSGFYSAFRVQLRSTLGAGPSDMSAGFSREGELAYQDALPQKGFSHGGFPQNGFSREGFLQDRREAVDRAFWDKLSASGKDATGNWVRESPLPSDPPPPFRYLGKAFGPFILFEKDETLYILDQHAAHERILYDELAEAKAAGQPLLVPFVFECESDNLSRRLAEAIPELERLGYELEPSGGGFVVNAVPAFLGEKGIQALVDCFSEGANGEKPAKDFLATMACRAAVKDGDFLDDSAARELIGKALALPFPRCPHGRPVWVKLDRTALYRMVGRITS